jgi:diacylglycerol kinase family enzyme
MDPAITVLVNGSAGSSSAAAAAGAIRDAFARAGRSATDVQTIGGPEIRGAAERAAKAGHTIIAAGGDGTVSSVAAVAVATGSTFGVIPLGTLNHFAKDAGVPLDLDAAVAAIVDGHAVPLDTGVVNGRTFVNNASVGFYARVVRERQLEQRRGRGKWVAFAIGLAREWRAYRQVTVRMTVNGTALMRRTPFVFVGNGEYVDEGLALGRRTSLTTGLLWIALAPECGRADMLMLTLRALAGRLTPDVALEQFHATEIAIEPRGRGGLVMDGELVAASAPFRCELRPRTLRTLLPAPAR